MSSVGRFIRTSDEEIIDVGEDKWQATQDFINEALEGLGSIAEAKRHPHILIEPKRSDDSSLWDICRVDWNLMEGLH